MNRIDTRFANLAVEGKTALLLYVTTGHPSLDASRRAAVALAQTADVVEIGVPFSDPVADGPIIQASTQTALSNGTSVADCFRLAEDVRGASETPIVFLTYYNPVLHFGLDTFAAACAGAGVDGLICPDLPAEEADPLQEALSRQGLDLIPMVSPTSTDVRLRAGCGKGSGFVYCVSRTGVTGVQSSMSAGLVKFLDRVRNYTDLPRAVGFGVSTPEHARQVAAVAEGVIVGSALVRLLEQSNDAELETNIENFVADMRRGMNGSA